MYSIVMFQSPTDCIYDGGPTPPREKSYRLVTSQLWSRLSSPHPSRVCGDTNLLRVSGENTYCAANRMKEQHIQ